MSISLDPKTTALVIIDIQNDFCPGGALAVSGGDQIVSGVIELAKQFDTVVLTQDWHPANHTSFASNHEGKNPYDSAKLFYGEQKLWPNHCVQGTEGAEFHKDIIEAGLVKSAAALVRKGSNPAVDSYSAFFENDHATTTGLSQFLRDKGITEVVLVGLAYDFCVGYSALDARKEGFEAVVVKDLTRAIKMPEGDSNTEILMDQQLRDAGVSLAQVPVAPSTATVLGPAGPKV